MEQTAEAIKRDILFTAMRLCACNACVPVVVNTDPQSGI